MGAVLRDQQLLAAMQAMGKDPKANLKTAIRRQLRILDEQNAVNRYVWYNLPSGIDGQLLERMLYYRGQLAFFYMESVGQFFILPYALCGSIDVYGRFLKITPLQFNGSTTVTEGNKEKPWINGLEKTPIYNVEDLDWKNVVDGAVILKDYTQQQAELITPRQALQEDLLDAMSEAIPLARTSLIANCGVRGVRVQTEDDAKNVVEAGKAIEKSALNGNPYVPVQSNMEFQELTGAAPLKSEEYLLYLQALDNYRMSLYGLETGGLFQKKSHMLEAENDMNAGHAKLVYQDGLTIRQKFCDIVNSIWGLGIWCDVSESVVAVDRDMNGVAADEKDQTGIPGDQPVMTEAEGE